MSRPAARAMSAVAAVRHQPSVALRRAPGA